MAEPVLRRWTVAEFFAWQDTQPRLYELVGGQPHLMAGAKNVHDDIVVNIVAALKNQTRGTGCRPFTGDGAVETLPGQIRRPDVGLDCGDRKPNGTLAAAPKLLVEVLSPSTRDFDTFDKLQEYKAVAGLGYILLIEPNQPLVKVWERGSDEAWSHRTIAGLEATIDLPTVAIRLAMTEVYDGVTFPAAPTLVFDNDVPSSA
jgi:Uma2 family endonuclease